MPTVLRRASRLPPGKTLETFKLARLPRPLLAKVRELAKGDLLERADNVLCFGLPASARVASQPRSGTKSFVGHSVLSLTLFHRLSPTLFHETTGSTSRFA